MNHIPQSSGHLSKTWMRYCRRHFLLVPAITLAMLGAHAATLLVYNNNDTGAGSLRQAVADNRALGGGSIIVFSNVVTGVITLTSGELLITNNLSILGPGAGTLTVSGNNLHRLFNLT